MAYLTPDKQVNISIGGKNIVISQKIIPDNTRAGKDICDYIKKGQLVKPQKKVNDATGKPRGITVHNTGAINVNPLTTMAEQYTRATYNENMRGAVVHYYVSGYKAIWQMLNTEVGQTERGWHASDGSGRRKSHNGSKWDLVGGNADTISIECIGSSVEAEDATALLVTHLCKKHGLNPSTDVYTHNYFMGLKEEIVPGARKNCPIYILPHLSSFISTIQEYYNGNAQTIESPAEKPVTPSVDKPVAPPPTPTEKVDVVYQIYTKNKWWGRIKNYNTYNTSGYAGVETSPMQAFKVALSKGDVRWRAHILNGTWGAWITPTGTGTLAYAGVLNRNVDAIQVKLVGDIAKDYDIFYRSSIVSTSGYLAWINGVNGKGSQAYSGIIGKPIDKIQMYVKAK